MKNPTSLGFAILGLLHDAPRSGYDLRKVFESTPMGHYSSSPGAIYPALKRLDERGLIEGRIDRGTSRRSRQLYRPTEAGTEVFRRWLARPVGSEDVIWRLDELLLRFAFQSFLEDDRVTRAFLAAFAREIDLYGAELESQREAMPSTTPLHGQLALESGIESYRAYRDWAVRALRRFEDRRS